MRYLHLHIDSAFIAENPVSPTSIRIISVVRSIFKFFSIRSLNTGLVRRINKRYQKLYLQLQGLVHVFENERRIVDALTLDNINELIKRTNNIYFKLEQSNFFDNQNTKEISESIIDSVYTLRRLYFNNNEANSDVDDTELINYVTTWSKEKYPEFIDG